MGICDGAIVFLEAKLFWMTNILDLYGVFKEWFWSLEIKITVYINLID